MDRNEFNAAAIPDYRGHIAILSVFVLPRFKTFFASFHAKLPLATRMVLTAGGFVGTWWWALLLGGTFFVTTIVGGLQTASGRIWLDKTLLKLPAVSDVVRYAIVERFCRILASMVKAGVPLPDAMIVRSVPGRTTWGNHPFASLCSPGPPPTLDQAVRGRVLLPPRSTRQARFES